MSALQAKVLKPFDYAYSFRLSLQSFDIFPRNHFSKMNGVMKLYLHLLSPTGTARTIISASHRSLRLAPAGPRLRPRLIRAGGKGAGGMGAVLAMETLPQLCYHNTGQKRCLFRRDM